VNLRVFAVAVFLRFLSFLLLQSLFLQVAFVSADAGVSAVAGFSSDAASMMFLLSPLLLQTLLLSLASLHQCY
jgi:hypothetical protein